MGNCSHRAVSDGGSVTVTQRDSKDLQNSGNMMDEYYRSRSCSSNLVREGTRRVGPKIHVSPQRRNGVWKAKLVIGRKQLEEILAVEGNTHALIDQLRFAAAAASASASTTSSKMVGDGNLSSRSREHYLC